MNFDQVRAAVLAATLVTPQTVMVAKVHIVANFERDPSSLISGFVAAMDARALDLVVVHPSVDSEPYIRQAGRYLSHSDSAAAVEAIWGLVHDGTLLRASDGMHQGQLHVGYAADFRGSGGDTSGWRFDEFTFVVPGKLMLAPSRRSAPQPLSDADLYLHQLGIPDLHPGVEQSLREAVRCFRYELYLACLAMLARAVEGAGIELGLALAAQPPGHAGKRAADFEGFIRDPMINLSQLIARVRDYYSERDLWADVRKSSGVNEQVLRNVAIWSDVVRESRNALPKPPPCSATASLRRVPMRDSGPPPARPRCETALASDSPRCAASRSCNHEPARPGRRRTLTLVMAVRVARTHNAGCGSDRVRRSMRVSALYGTRSPPPRAGRLMSAH